MRFQHDCEKCKPLGEFGDADLYYCDAHAIGGATVIARYSNDGGDYQSWMVFADKIPALGEAEKRAIEAGYMTPGVTAEVRRLREAIEGALAQLDEDDGLFVELQEALKTPNVEIQRGAKAPPLQCPVGHEEE